MPLVFDVDWIVGVKVTSSNRSFILLNVYLPYECNDNIYIYMDCLGKIYAILEDLDNSCMIITSDFNANISKSDSFNGNHLTQFGEQFDYII